MTTLMIEVQAEDIEKGVRRNACLCAVSQSLKRAGHANTSVSLDPDDGTITVFASNMEGNANLPNIVQALRAWDNGAELNPFSFTIEMERSA